MQVAKFGSLLAFEYVEPKGCLRDTLPRPEATRCSLRVVFQGRAAFLSNGI